MKRVIIGVLVLTLMSCSDQAKNLQINVLKAYNSEAENVFKATDLVVVHKKGNEYIGLITTKNNSKIMLSIFSDGKEFFYWVADGNLELDDRPVNHIENQLEEVSMENFPEELIGEWNYNCSGEYAQFSKLEINTENGTYYILGMHDTDPWNGKITSIQRTNGIFKLNVSCESEGTNYDEEMTIKISGDKLKLNSDEYRVRCN